MKMRRKTIRLMGATILMLAGWWLWRQPSPQLSSFEVSSLVASGQSFSYEDYAAVLNKHVSNQGMVDYKSMKAGRQKLDTFVSAMAQLEPKVYDQWTKKEQIAFWINAYNALTLQAIINNYPIASSFLKSVVFPKNSVRQIPGVWDKLEFLVMGRKMSLDQIEHETLRKQFNEPRIHMALVCAAMGCPPLRSEPFTGDKLDAQLDDQTRKFLSDSKKFRIDRRKGEMYLSPVFKWFGGDFIKTYDTDKKLAGRDPAERAVLHFINRHLEASDREYLETAKYDIKYLDYDWSLNEQAARREIS